MSKSLDKAVWVFMVVAIALFGFLVLTLINQVRNQKTTTTTIQVIKKYPRTTLIMVPAGKVLVPNSTTDYYVDVVENNKNITYRVSPQLFQQIEAGKTYSVTKKTRGTRSLQEIILEH